MSIVNKKLETWVKELSDWTKPDAVHFCDGSQAEYDSLISRMLESGTLHRLNQDQFPGCYLHRSDPGDVARVEHCTFICSQKKEDAGPTNNWMSPDDARAKVWPLFKDAMKGRTMYVVPYLMGPEASPFSKVGVEITDSPYVAANMRIMTRMGKVALDRLGDSDDFVRGTHSLGDLSPERRFILHFPETREIWSVGSGYGGNALLGKKCHALRIASVQARDEGWLAEHMLILAITTPAGEKYHICAAFPSACGKTNLAMLIPPASMPGYKVETVGDDISWLNFGDDGRLYAINPENGFFGVVPGTSSKTNPNALASTKKNSIFTNVAETPDHLPWWEGHDDPAPATLTDWKGGEWHPGADHPAAHPNSRFTAPIANCPSASKDVESAKGVPIDAIVFGGRRAKLAPLVYESFSWQHGTFVGATMASETTAAATGAVGVVRRDPMAMLPFCGYNMGDYWNHWLSIGDKPGAKLPKVFHVNWFKRGADGKFIWPGFGDNLRVLDWMIRRVKGEDAAQETPIGYVPKRGSIAENGLNVSAEKWDELLKVAAADWREELSGIDEFFAKFGDKLPAGIREERDALAKRLG
ncbi:MAG: phosphoenolpyruvate carboxykinase (GTP) [Planctomycetes bacterium]|nr:phosphoenolpyruvate carboxykinase (GTP) [Planctomycetota bacterium]